MVAFAARGGFSALLWELTAVVVAVVCPVGSTGVEPARRQIDTT